MFFLLRRMWVRRVVLPAPKNPLKRVSGSLPSAAACSGAIQDRQRLYAPLES